MSLNFLFGIVFISCNVYTIADQLNDDIAIIVSDKNYRRIDCGCDYSLFPICGNDLLNYENECVFICAQKNAAKKGLRLRMLHTEECDEQDINDVYSRLHIFLTK